MVNKCAMDGESGEQALQCSR